MTMKQTAFAFFDACETGKGWTECSQFCTPDATFSSQADALEGIETVEAYTRWMQGLLIPMPDGRYELTSFAVDDQRGTVAAAAIFHGTHTVEAGGNAPTGKSTSSDYAYIMTFEDGKVSHVTKIWNDVQAVRQLGWA